MCLEMLFLSILGMELCHIPKNFFVVIEIYAAKYDQVTYKSLDFRY